MRRNRSNPKAGGGSWLARFALAAAVSLALPATAAAAGSNAGFIVAGVLAPNAPLRAGDYVWEAEGVAPGPLTIVVDLGAERLYAYQGGVEIGRAFIMYGADEKPTPTGTFTVLEKDADHVSNLYFAPMPYMLRLTWDGVAIHGSEVDERYATHGCIGVPDEFAALLFARARLGDRVLVTRGWRPDIYAS